jgi:hypothetical protein
MAGTNDRIHGYNAIYRNGAANNFDSFVLGYGRPGQFINRQVVGAPIGITDHQGHIVPQNILNTVLDPMMNAMAAQITAARLAAGIAAATGAAAAAAAGAAAALSIAGGGDAVAAAAAGVAAAALVPPAAAVAAGPAGLTAAGAAKDTYILANTATHAWLPTTEAYGVAIGAPMYDFTEDDPENQVGGFFSIVTWNPVNICRAPEDARRNGVPGITIDQAVRDHLNANQGVQGVNGPWLAALDALIGLNNAANTIAYITACSATLAGQQAAGIGYYSFAWQNNPAGDLIPT